MRPINNTLTTKEIALSFFESQVSVEVFYLNTIEQLLDQLEACLPCCRLLTGKPIIAVFES